MPPSIVIAIIYFLLVAFISGASALETANPLFSYYRVQARFFAQHLLVFIFFAALFSLLYFWFNRQKGMRLINYYYRVIKRFIVVIIFGSMVSFVLLFFIAFIEMNALSLLANIRPGILGVESGTEQIIGSLKQNNSAPMVVVGSQQANLLPAIARAQSGRDSFYGSRIVPYIPQTSILPIKQVGEGVVMVGDTLVVSEINSTAFQTISPVVSYSFIRQYFPKRNIKFYPQVELMDEEQYKDYRKQDYEHKLMLFDEVVADLDQESEDLAETVGQQQELLVQEQEDLEQARQAREKQWIDCVNEGFYQDGEFIKVNTRPECQEQLGQTDSDIVDQQQEIVELQNLIRKNQERLEQIKQYIDYYNNQKILTRESSAYVSYEFAAFQPPDKIRIAVSSQTDPQSVADYLELLIHEYLHYSTYEEGSRLTSAFFVEGLTEYFARKIIRSNLGVETNLGYPANVKIIEQFSKRISDSDLANIYFNNDQDRLEEMLDRAYGGGFYENNIVVLETLHYSANAEKLLDLANTIMDEIGGEHLNVEDLQTTQSTYY